MKKNSWIFLGVLMTIGSATAFWNTNKLAEIIQLNTEAVEVEDLSKTEENFTRLASTSTDSQKNNWQITFGPQKVIVENLGQFKADPTLKLDDQIKFAYKGSTEDVFFTPTKIVLEIVKKSLPEKTEEVLAQRLERKKKGFASREEVMAFRNDNKKITFDKEILISEWVNCNPNPELIPEKESTFKHSYMINQADGSEGSIDQVRSFEKLTYRNLYPNIDVVYELHPETGYKYSVYVKPGGDISQVKLKYNKNIKLGKDGKIRTETKFGEIVDHAPITFYEGESATIIPSAYLVNDNEISFSVGSYDASKTLVIDPWTQSPSFPTNWDCVWECETDAAGNSYLIGGVMPLTLQKYNSAGVLQWSYNTPYDSTAWLGGFATDDAGNSFVTNGSAAKILKVNNAGALQWSNNNPGGIFTLTEFWNIAFNCDQTKLVIAGTSGIANPVPCVYNINVTNGNVIASQDVTGPGDLFSFPPNTNEVRAITATANNKYYFLTHDSIGYVSDDLSLCPNQNGPFHVENGNYNMSYKCENWRYDNSGIEALAYFGGFVFVNRGNRLDKRDFNSAAILQSVTIPGGGWTASLGQNQTQNSGIAIDECGNIYVGSKTGVYKFDQNLAQTGFFATSFNVYDVEITSTGEIIAGGSTGTSSNNTRTGTLQSFAASACAQPVTVCCNTSICPIPPVCANNAPFSLTTDTPGGTWSISPATAGFNTSTGVFDPSLAGPGSYSITYTLPCGSESTTVIVSPCQSLEVCIETNGDLTVSNGIASYNWDQWIEASSTAITNQSQCEACGYTWFAGAPPFLPAQCQDAFFQQITTCNSPAGWEYFTSGTTITPPVSATQMQVTDAVGETLIIILSNLQACTSNPCPTLSITTSSQTNVSCFGGNNGAATVSASGGDGPYTYTWTPGNLNGASQTGLTAGTYTVNVTDFNNCPGSTTVTITQPATAVSVTASATDASCGSNNGTATANPSGGTGSYTYSWSPGGGTTATINNLASGTYTVTVTDVNGCTATANANVGSAGGPSISVVSSNDVSCNGLSDGSATVSGSGGTGSLTYNWMPGSLSGASQTGLAAGTYTVTVTDGNNCSNSTTVTINEPTALTASAGTINPANCGATDGSAVVNASGGTGSLTYAWTPNVSSTSSANNIAAGPYSILVTDANNCSQTVNLIVPSIGGPTVSIIDVENVSCSGLSDGSATVSTVGGNAPFTYLWSPSGGSGVTSSGLSAGTYSVLVTDDLGCIGTADVTISSPAPISITGTVTDAGCGTNDGQIAANATGGTGTISYEWTPTGQTSSTITNLGGGNYSVTATDANGCSSTQSFEVNISGTLDISVVPEFATINQGETVQIFASGATSYSWSPVNGLSCTDCPDPIASPSMTTTYTVTGDDGSGCIGTASVTIFVTQVCGELYVPTVFSPNEHGPTLNNKLCVMGNCISELTYAIYNRWGEKIFETTDPESCWDGTYKGQPVNSGVYAYKLYAKLFDNTVIEESGNLTVVR